MALKSEVVAGIERSLGLLEERMPEAKVVCYGLITDEDLRTLYGAVLTAADLAEMEPGVRFWPAEWIEHSDPFSQASTTLGAIADGHYAKEGDDVGPDDDHLRPWKGELYATLFEALRDRKQWGTFDEHVFLIATSHGPNDWLFKRVDAATRALNTTKVYKAWKKAWAQ